MPVTIDDMRSYVSTPARRRSFYCHATQKCAAESAAFFILVENFRSERKKRQAFFINDWFIKGNIPPVLQEGGYLSQLNTSPKILERANNSVSSSIKKIGKTFSDKIENSGGGIGGVFGAIGVLMSGTKLDADLFSEAQLQAFSMLSPYYGASYRPDGTYQPNGLYAAQVIIFKEELTKAGFDPDSLGFY